MGHVRLGTLPDTAPWRRVVARIADGGSAAAVAAATTAAAVDGLERAKNDPGVARVAFLLARTPLAARADDFPGALSAVGVHVPPDPTLFDLTGAFADAVRAWYAASRARRSDVADLAELAALEALVRCLAEGTRGLIPSAGGVARAARARSTRKGFAGLAHAYFARFAHRFLTYHLGRELSLHVGGHGRFPDRAAHAAFVADLEAHCGEAALVVRDFAAGWHSKAAFEAGLTEAQARGFSAHALTKLAGEFARRGAARVA